MPIAVVSFLSRANPQTVPFILLDTDLRGGFRVLDTLAERDSMHPGSLKAGMLVLTNEDNTVWQLQSDGSTWAAWNAPSTGGGGGSGLVRAAQDPLSVDVAGTLSIAAARLVPVGGTAGQVLGKHTDGTVQWINNSASGAANTRSVAVKSDLTEMQPSTNVEFTLDLSKSVLLTKVEVNAPGLLLEGFSTPNRADNNPYTFASASGRLIDEGISVKGDGGLDYDRRYAFLLNQETPTTNTSYWRLTNNGTTALTPQITIEYLILE